MLAGHDKYCAGNDDMKICIMCLNKNTNEQFEKFSPTKIVMLKSNMKMVSNDTCKKTNGSYYISKTKAKA